MHSRRHSAICSGPSLSAELSPGGTKVFVDIGCSQGEQTMPAGQPAGRQPSWQAANTVPPPAPLLCSCLPGGEAKLPAAQWRTAPAPAPMDLPACDASEPATWIAWPGLLQGTLALPSSRSGRQSWGSGLPGYAASLQRRAAARAMNASARQVCPPAYFCTCMPFRAVGQRLAVWSMVAHSHTPPAFLRCPAGGASCGG